MITHCRKRAISAGDLWDPRLSCRKAVPCSASPRQTSRYHQVGRDRTHLWCPLFFLYRLPGITPPARYRFALPVDHAYDWQTLSETLEQVCNLTNRQPRNVVLDKGCHTVETPGIRILRSGQRRCITQTCTRSSGSLCPNLGAGSEPLHSNVSNLEPHRIKNQGCSACAKAVGLLLGSKRTL